MRLFTALRHARHHLDRAGAPMVRPTATLLTISAGLGSAAAFTGGHVGLAVSAADVSDAHRVEAVQVAAPAPPPPAPLPAPTTTTTAPAATAMPLERGPLPIGKGMWLWLPERVEGGNVQAIVARAQAVGLTHLYVRTGSSVQGFHGAPFLDALLPAAHAAGLRIYGWDFPYFSDVGADVARAVQAITYTTPDGHRIDGFTADIETPFEGTHLTSVKAAEYGNGLRGAVGPAYPLIVAVPRPSGFMLGRYPYTEVVAAFDAIAPMVYWLNRQPDSDVAEALDYLSRYGKPLLPVGQAYDGAAEGGRPGPPTGDEIARFLGAAEAHGASAASFWSWQHASPEIWDTIARAQQFTLPLGDVANLSGAQVRAIQVLLSQLGFDVPLTASWDQLTAAAFGLFQQSQGVQPTGNLLDALTRGLLLGPLAIG